MESEYEPIVLVAAPILAIVIARGLQSVASKVQEKGAKGAILGFIISSANLVPGVNGYIETQKGKVVEKMQSGKKEEGWRSDLPGEGLGRGVLVVLKEAKSKDAIWQGRCSGAVYIGSEDHLLLTNEAYSMWMP